MSLDKTDLLLVNRDGESFQMAEDEIKTNLADTDLLWVQRDGVDYSILGVEIKNSGAGGDVEPDPETQVDVNGALGGIGTKEDPFIIPPSNAFPYGGLTESSVSIHFKNLEWQGIIEFEDENRGANGTDRFEQPLGVVNQSGSYTTKLYYKDEPLSAEDGSFTALLTVGDSVYFSWSVVQTDTLPPILDTVTLYEVGSPTQSFTNTNIQVDVEYTEVGKPEAQEALQLQCKTRAVSRASSSNIKTSNFVSVPEVEIKFINNDVAIAAKDINWDSSFSSTISNNVVDTSDAFTSDTTSIFWMGFTATNGEKFTPQLREQLTPLDTTSRYTYWFYSDTGTPGSWFYNGMLRHLYQNSSGIQSKERYSSPSGIARYWICFNSTYYKIQNDEPNLENYIPYDTRETWPANFFGSQGYDWGLLAIKLEDNTSLTQFIPGNYILHADTDYVDVEKTGKEVDYRWNSYYIPLEKTDTYPLFIDENMMLTDFQQIIGRVYDCITTFGYGAYLMSNGNFPDILIGVDTVAPTYVKNCAYIFDVGEVITEGTIRTRTDNLVNWSYASDGGGWVPVKLSNALPTDGDIGSFLTVPVGTRWIAAITPPDTNTQPSGWLDINHEGAAEFKLRQRSPAGQLQYVDQVNSTVYLNNVIGDFTPGKELFNTQVNTTEQVLNTLNAELDADGNVTNLVPFEVEPVVQNIKNQIIKFPTAFASGVTPAEMLPYGSVVEATATATNVAGSDQITSDPYFPPASTFNFSFQLGGFGRGNEISFNSDPITMEVDDTDYVFFVWAGGPTTGGKCQKQYYTGVNWYNGIAGGAGDYGDDGDKNPGANAPPPRASLYLTKRRSVIVEVATIDGSGGVETFNTIQDGLGLNTQNIGQNKLFTGGSGTEVQLKVVRNTDQTTGASQVTTKGTGYQVGDLLTWEEGFGLGGLTQMDDVYDKLLYGIAGNGPIVGSGPGAQSTGSGATNNTTSSIYPSDGGNGVRYTCDYCNGGDGGSAGWGGAPNASGSGGHEGRYGNDAWTGWSGPNANYVSGTVTAENPGQSANFYINNAEIVTVDTNQTVTVIKLQPSDFTPTVTTLDYTFSEETE